MEIELKYSIPDAGIIDQMWHQEVFEELLRFDSLLHFHHSRRMTAEETFLLPADLYPSLERTGNEKTGPFRIRFDYAHIHPVTREASFTILP